MSNQSPYDPYIPSGGNGGQGGAADDRNVRLQQVRTRSSSLARRYSMLRCTALSMGYADIVAVANPKHRR